MIVGNNKPYRASNTVLDIQDAAPHLGFTTQTFAIWVRRGLLPPTDPTTGGWTKAALDEAVERVKRDGVQNDNPSRRHSHFIKIYNCQRVWKKLEQGDGAGHWLFYFRPTGEPLPYPWGSPAFMTALIDWERRSATQEAAQDPSENTPKRSDGKSLNQAPVTAQRSLKSPPAAPKLLTQIHEIGPTRQHPVTSSAPLFLTPDELSERWRGQITVETLSNWRSARVGPPAIKLRKAILYRIDLIEQWEQQQLIPKPKP